MSELLERLYEEAHSAWRFRWIGLGLAAVLSLLGWAVVLALPDRFEAQASIFVDTRTALQPVLQGLAMEQDVDVQLNYVRQSLLSGDQLREIARESGVLPATVTDPREVAQILGDFAERVVLRVTSANGSTNARDRDSAGKVYSFVYQDGSRDRSITVIDTVLKHFVEETLGGRREGSDNAQRFLEDQIRTYEIRLREAEKRLAEFKKTNIGLMPTEQGGYFAQLQTELDLARASESNLTVAQSRRAELARQLRGESVVGATGAGGTALSGGALSGGTETLARIRDAQGRLDEILLRFTEKHPDVIAAQTTLKELEARRAAEVESLRRGDAAAVAASGVSSNPVYQNIQLQLNQVDVEIASLRGQRDQHRSKAAELRQRLDTAPTVEAELAALNRDYDINKAQYEALLANLEKARLGGEADTAGSVRFEVVQPPTAPFTPASPLRVLLLAGVFVGAMGAGGVATFLLHLLNPVVGSIRGLAELTGLPVLGVVSAAFPEQMSARARRQLLKFMGASGVLAAMFAVVVVLNSSGFRLGVSAVGGGAS